MGSLGVCFPRREERAKPRAIGRRNEEEWEVVGVMKNIELGIGKRKEEEERENKKGFGVVVVVVKEE